MNVLFYETNDNFSLDCMRILAGDRYENNGVEVSYYVPIELMVKQKTFRGNYEKNYSGCVGFVLYLACNSDFWCRLGQL